MSNALINFGEMYHTGIVVDEVEVAKAEFSALMVNRGMPLVAKVGVDSAEADAMIVLHQMKTGAYIELVSSLAREQMFGGK